MGCQGRRGMLSCVLGALLFAALAAAAPASANEIAVGDVQVGESASATFTITRVAGFASGAVTVNYRTIDDSATSPADFTGDDGSRTFPAVLFGTTQTQQVTIAIADDALNELSERFHLAISGPEVVDGDAVATIADNDPLPALTVADSPAVQEGTAGAKATFAVHLLAASGRAVSIAYATVDGSAMAGQDYAKTEGTLVLPAGTRDGSISVGVLDDGVDEPAETFQLRLAAPDGATRDPGGLVAATILDNDDPPASSVPPPATGAQPLPTLPIPPTTGSSAPTGGGPAAPTSLGLSSPRLKRPSTVLVTLSCPQIAGRCAGRITLFSLPNNRSSVKALRKERRLGRVEFSVAGGRSQTFALSLGRTDVGLLKRTGRMRVRAYAITHDSAGRTGVRTVSGTLIARTAHSSSRR